MRIQHNIMAMNSYRNYSNNTSALSKNLEKLSSGYKINRAGDDAAGLAISEKMRAQITGLNAAQKNVKDAVSFVKTAEGAMQEIQDMLNRMKYLATQSANGTYRDDVDRQALQDEVDSLLEEIDRIAQSANFNGIHMLNGPDGSDTSSSNTSAPTAPAGTVKGSDGAGITGITVAFDAKATDAQKTALSTALSGKSITVTTADGDSNSSYGDDNDTLTISGLSGLPAGYKAYYTDAAGDEKAVPDNGKLTVGSSAGQIKGDEGLVLTIKDESGDTPAVAGTITIGKATKVGATEVEFASAAGDASKAAEGGEATAAKPTFEAKDGVDISTDFDISAIDVSNVKGLTEDATVKMSYGTNKTLTVKVGNKTYTSAAISTAPNKDDKIKLYTAGDADGEGEDGYVEVTVAKASSTILSGTNAVTEAEVGTAKAPAEDSGNSGGTTASGAKTGNFTITMQIGDTSDGYNQLQMNIQSVSTASLNIGALKGDGTAGSGGVGSRSAAATSIATIESAINTVSSIRGKLGAYQNRLEHTQNNLSVMTENIQDAESTIRDTDVAEEMMSYVKNNILVQSAQAMLAQANQVPQGVLQLLG